MLLTVKVITTLDVDVYTEGLRTFTVGFVLHYSLTIHIMFFQVSSPVSSNIDELYINPTTSEVIVEYKSGGTYSYTNVDRVAIDDLLYAREGVSLGQWVNTHLAKNAGVICDNLDALIRDIRREPIAA